MNTVLVTMVLQNMIIDDQNESGDNSARDTMLAMKGSWMATVVAFRGSADEMYDERLGDEPEVMFNDMTEAAT